MSKVFGYVRVSGKNQVDGDGPERQRDAIKAFATRHGLELLGEGFDGGVSGTIEGMERPELARIIEQCTDGAGIVVEKLDRLARDLMVQELLLAECRKMGVPVFAADQGELIDLTACDGDPTRKLIRQVMGALAEWEKTNIVLKLRAARNRVKAKTGRCEGAKPYGAKDGEMEVVHAMTRHFAEFGSCQLTAEWLENQGMRTRSGTPWNRGTVWAIIKRYSHEVELHKLDIASARPRTRRIVDTLCSRVARWQKREYAVGTRGAKEDEGHTGSIEDRLKQLGNQSSNGR